MSFFIAPQEKIVLKSFDRAAADRLCAELNIPLSIAAILAGRGLDTYDTCKAFFCPGESSFHDPFLFKEMRPAVNRLRTAINKNELITVYGDYDADGVTATAVTIRILKRLGAKCDYYLPNRLTQGYGISAQGINEIIKRGTSLIITVDCGITAAEEISIAEQAGIDCIVTDHHLPQGPVPKAIAVIDPCVEACGYPDATLAGAGVALKLCQALSADMGQKNDVWMDYMDLVALGTAADIVKLTGENRAIASMGFEKLGKTTNAGLKALMEQLDIPLGSISTRQVVFQLAPCINAAGRLGDPSRGVVMLLTDDSAEAALYASELREANRERQALDLKVQNEAIAWTRENCEPSRDMAIVASSENWHAGVIGIAASRIVETFYRPAFLFSIGTDGKARGSGRSIPGLHLLDALNECSDLLEAFGGHAAAAGATIRIENIGIFREKFNKAVFDRIGSCDLRPSITADAEVTLPELTRKFFNILRRMEPFGPGNMRPVLLLRNCNLCHEPRIVGQKHLKMKISQNGAVMDAIAFNFAGRIDEIRKANSMSVAFSLDENEWNGQVSLQMKVKGVET